MRSEVQERAEGEYDGVYRAYWELAYLRVRLEGRRLFGLKPNTEDWYPRFPDGFEFPWPEQFGGTPVGRLSKPRYFRMRFRAIPGPRGRYGHRGWCRREAEITHVLEIAEVERPS